MLNRFAGETATVKNIPLDRVRALPQVRTSFKESSIAELAADIEAHGLLQPIVVRPDGNGYTVVIGERRLRAMQKIKAEHVPAIIAKVPEGQIEEIQLIENIQREDLNAKDLSGSIHSLWKRYGSVAQVAKRCNKSKSWVSKRLALALDVGALTVQLLDANVKDVEMLYAFGTLEKADEQRARALLPDILEKTKGRKDVQAELQIALGRKADEAPKSEDKNLDLFKDNGEAIAAIIDTSKNLPHMLEQTKDKLSIALAALNQILGTATADKNGDANQLKKLAREAIDAIGC